MPGPMKHDYTHEVVEKQKLAGLVTLLAELEEAGGSTSEAQLQQIADTLPKGSATLGTGDFSGLIGWKISKTTTRGHRYFSPFLIAAERLLTAVAGTVIFNHSPAQEDAAKPRSRLYPQLSYPGHNGSDHIALNRITMDAQPKESVLGGSDYHDCSPRALTVQPGGRAFANRRSAVYSVRAAYHSLPAENRPFASWEEYEAHISRAFRLLDRQRAQIAERRLSHQGQSDA